MSPRRSIAILIAAGAVGYAGWKGVGRFYLAPRAKLAEDIKLHRDDIAAKQRHVDRMRGVRQELAEIASATLAAEPDAFEHRLRTELVALAEVCGLTGVEVRGSRPTPRGNPVINARVNERTALRTRLRARPDFYVVRATLEGRGDLSEVATVLATLQAQRWVGRIESFNIRPEGDRRMFSLRVDLTTLFVPDLVNGAPAARMAELPEGELERARRLGSVNFFRKPDPAPPVIAQKEQPPAPPPPPPPAPEAPRYGDWRLVGVMRGSRGPEAILVNGRTRETRTLAPGEEVLGFVFVEGSGELAEFRREGEKLVLRNGQTLEQHDQLN